MTREYEDLVSTIAETIEEVLTADPMILPDTDQMTDAGSIPGGPMHAFVLDFEKIIWHFPDPIARLIEDAG